jgi:hypothetical protein
MIFAFMRGALSSVIWLSSAAGIRISQSASSAAPGFFYHFGFGISAERALFVLPFHEIIEIHALLIDKGTIDFCNCNKYSSSFYKKFGRVITHIYLTPEPKSSFLKYLLKDHTSSCPLHGYRPLSYQNKRHALSLPFGLARLPVRWAYP